MSRHQKDKTNLDFTEARDSEWQWHQLGHMQVCTSLQTDNHASTPPLSFSQAGCPSCRPTNSIKALKAPKSTEEQQQQRHKVSYGSLLLYATQHQLKLMKEMIRDSLETSEIHSTSSLQLCLNDLQADMHSVQRQTGSVQNIISAGRNAASTYKRDQPSQ